MRPPPKGPPPPFGLDASACLDTRRNRVYLGGGYFPVVRFNVVWRTDFETVSPKPVREFTVGWNY